ncbi:right-handed parallel beta-helix repeat-containing protein [Sulfitobacter sp. TSTF-M16]|uniref:Right-handed parallel beta-helix repeat-containing protein n=1 Tax=Sulfitobacter aestuariivivens TaxID=2766981 RepID=A0A927HGJ6_9RHOB|nr:right-handed parallel beta-helix repeat-containing protein [Sulfitobacter aestuariivivens]MBD3666056.1 right-handed parallel beta-helix repeat-containing protein [Sulfitobacter aestuariivivens]
MASLLRLPLLRFCVVAVALLAPVAALSGPTLDAKELRAAVRAFEARTAGQVLRPVDVAALRADLGLGTAGRVAAPSDDAATGKPALSGAGGLFALQTGQAIQTPNVRSSGQREGPVDAGTTNFRLMMASLAQSYSGINTLSVITAQGARGSTALSIRSGTVTLADVRSLFAANGMPPRADGTFTAPLVLWPDATLRLSPGERMGLARDQGAFVLSMGHLEINGALIEVVGGENPHEPVFMPFVTVLGSGSIQMVGSTLRGLGFGRTAKFAGLTVAGNPLMQAKRRVILRGNLFDDIKIVTIAGAPAAEISGNTFSNARNNALNVMNAPYAVVRGNLFRGTAPTNAIRVDLGSDHALIAQNVFLGGERVAVLINGNSNSVAVRDNLIWRRDGAGIKFLNTRCGLAEGNILVDNRQKGIEVRKSDGVVVQQNLITGNRSAGVWVSAQAEDARTAVRDNIFEANGAGLSAATGAEIWISGNNFSRQLPKLLDGDIARLSTRLVRDLRGEGSWRLNRGKAHAQEMLTPLCGSET